MVLIEVAEGSVMSDDTSIASERQKIIERARAGSPADAAYLIVDFSRRRFNYKEESLSLKEIAPELSQPEIDILERRANALFADEGYFGEKHWIGRTREDTVKRPTTSL